MIPGRPSLLAALLAVALAGPTVPAAGQVAELRPVDEATADPSLFHFRQRLVTALATRDTTFLLAHVHPSIKLGFGGEHGIDDFRTLWLDDPASEIWAILAEVVGGGGVYGEGSGMVAGTTAHFTAPYVFAAFPDGYDGYDHATIVGVEVPVRAAPDPEGEVLVRLSHVVVRVVDFHPEHDGGPAEDWVLVELADGRRGFVTEPDVRSPIDYRARWEKVDGAWLMTFLGAGD